MTKLLAMATTELFMMQTKLRKLATDKSGATMIEYSVLIGLITALVIAIVVAVGTWINTRWTGLNTAIQAAPALP